MRIKSHREKIKGWNCKKNFNSKSHLKNSNKKNEDQIWKKIYMKEDEIEKQINDEGWY